jgi:3-methylfumaryl-CoA hydratase
VSEVVRRSELITPEPAEALAGALDVVAPDLERDGLPLTWHWLHLLDRTPARDLGPDGHALRGVVPAPPAPGRRRMWAGGAVHRLGPLRPGEVATRTSRVAATTEKQGHSGPLTFVAVEHVVEQRGEVVVRERQDVLYREESGALAPSEATGRVPVGDGEWEVQVTPTLLFRFSALTYNSHRIHYDRDYARDVEGYPGLVVHGPLQALLMAELARARGQVATSLEYRLVAPLHDHQGLVVGLSGDDAQVRDASGRRTAQGRLGRGQRRD